MRGRRDSFVVRAVQDRRGRISGVIERVATGAKEAFTDMDTIGVVIARMLKRSGDAGVPSRPRKGSA
jgi:hypothetical protein